ncbi:MAG: choice-of-anchor D domain-containing protein [Myxococcota bacterium]|nr:choice-of-anchor D domain-containing protein [Myxococcota bacterium]
MLRYIIPVTFLGCTLETINQMEEKNTETAEDDNTLVFGDLIVDPGILDFGGVELEDSKTEELVFINNGSSTLNIVNASLDGDSAFSLESSFLDFELDADAEEIVTVQFTPNEEKVYGATLNILLSSESGTGAVEIIGTGGDATAEPSGEPGDDPVEGGLSLSKTSHDYGEISLYSTATLILDVVNESEEAITITNVTSSNAAFELSPYSNVQVDEAISAGITRTMTVNFTPDQEITYDGTITLETDSDITPEISIDLSGEGVYQCQVCAPRLSINGQYQSPLTINTFQIGIDFMTFQMYPNPAVETFTIANSGDEPLEITSITVTNDTNAPGSLLCGTDGNFTIPELSTPISLNPIDQAANTADSFDMDVTYTYAGSEFLCGENSALGPSTLTITSNDPTNPTFIVNLEATVLGSF